MERPLIDLLREHAYWYVALDNMLTVIGTEHGARVAPHWINEIDMRIASELPDDIIRAEYERRFNGL